MTAMQTFTEDLQFSELSLEQVSFEDTQMKYIFVRSFIGPLYPQLLLYMEKTSLAAKLLSFYAFLYLPTKSCSVASSCGGWESWAGWAKNVKSVYREYIFSAGSPKV